MVELVTIEGLGSLKQVLKNSDANSWNTEQKALKTQNNKLNVRLKNVFS